MLVAWLFAPVSAGAAEGTAALAADLSPAYADVPQIAAAPSLARSSVIAALTGEALPYEAKLALACAATAPVEGASPSEGTAAAYVAGLAAALRLDEDALDTSRVPAPHRALLAYLRAREDPSDLSPVSPEGSGIGAIDPVALVGTAVHDRPDDFALAVTALLVGSADRSRGDACAVASAWDALLARVPTEGRNLRPAAVELVTAAVRAGCPAR